MRGCNPSRMRGLIKSLSKINSTKTMPISVCPKEPAMEKKRTMNGKKESKAKKAI